jgi:hypothetical protein
MIHEQGIKYVNVTPPAAIIDNSAVTTAEIDTKGYDYARVIVILGATDIAMTALAVQQSDVSGSGHANVTGLIYGTSTDIDGDTSTLPSATEDDGIFIFEIDLRGKKRYLDVSATVGDGTAGTFVTIIAELSRAKEGPISISEKGCTGALRA